MENILEKINIDKILKLNSGDQRRSFSGELRTLDLQNKTRGVFDPEKRLLEFSLSSETPVLRKLKDKVTGEEYAFYEILGHNPDEVDLSRLKNGSNIFWNHKIEEEPLGVIEVVNLINKRIIEIGRFSKNEKPDRIFKDIDDGIITKTSVGYHVFKMIDTNEYINGLPVLRITLWQPYESTICGVGEDDSVGIGRAKKEGDNITMVLEKPCDDAAGKGNNNQALDMPGVVEPAKSEENLKNVPIFTGVRTMEKKDDAAPAVLDPVQKMKAENEAIINLGKDWGEEKLALDYIKMGKSESDFSRAVVKKFNDDRQAWVSEKAKGKSMPSEVGMTEKEVKNYSVMNLIRSVCGDKDASGKEYEAGFEREISQHIQTKMERAPKREGAIYVPREIQVAARVFNPVIMNQLRAMSAGTASAGGYTIQTQLDSANMIDVLRNRLALARLGATYLTGLRDNVDIPRVTVATSGSWVAENTAASEGSVTLDKVSLSPKTATANTIISRKLRQQSSIDVDNFVMMELMQSLSITIDSAGINGTAANDQPRGVRNQSGINTVSTATDGSALTWAKIVDMETAIANDNADQGTMKYLSNAKVRGSAKQIVKESGQAIYLYDGFTMNGMELITSNQIPSNITKGSGTNLSTILLGYWRDLLLGEWGNFEIARDTSYYSTDGRHRITCFQDYDVAVRHPESFCEMSGVIAA